MYVCIVRCGHGDIILFKDNSKKEVGRKVAEVTAVKHHHVAEVAIKIHYRVDDIAKLEGK